MDLATVAFFLLAMLVGYYAGRVFTMTGQPH